MPDQDYLSLIRQTEEKAAAMIADAQAKARETLEAARTEATRRLNDAREDAEKIIDQTLREASEASEIHTEEQTVIAEAQAGQLLIDAQPAFPEAVRAVAERIVK